MLLIIFHVQTDRVQLSKRNRADGPRVRFVATHGSHPALSPRRIEFDPGRSRTSDLESAQVHIGGVFSHEWVTDIQSAKHGGDDDGHVTHGDRYCRLYSAYKGGEHVEDELGTWESA